MTKLVQTAPAATVVTPANSGESIRATFARVSFGLAVYSACQWAILAVIAKLGTAELVGEYALAVAVTTPVLALAQMNLRSVLVTDAHGNGDFREYRDLRFFLLGLGLLFIGAVALHDGGGRARIIVTLLVGLIQAGEWVADIYYGRMQQQDRTARMAVSLTARGLLGILVLAVALRITGSLTQALCWMFAARTLVYFAYDSTYGLRGLPSLAPAAAWRPRTTRQWSIFKQALPLGVVLMLAALVMNTPRYFIAAQLGDRPLGVFSAIFSLASAGNLLMNSLGQSALPRLTRLYSSGDVSGFRGLSLKMTGLGAGLGIAGIICVSLIGQWVIKLVYRPEYAREGNLLLAAMAVSSVVFVASMLGYCITAARRFTQQMPLQLACLAATALAAYLLIPRMGLIGAALSVGLGACVQVAAEAWILHDVLKTMAAGAFSEDLAATLTGDNVTPIAEGSLP